MAKRGAHTVGLSIGTSRVTCIIGEPGDVSGALDIVGIGEAEARGPRKGVIVNPENAVEAIKHAVEAAERMRTTTGQTRGDIERPRRVGRSG